MTLIPGLEQQLVEAARQRRARRGPQVLVVAVLALAVSALAGVALIGVSGDETGGGSATAGGVSPELTETLGVFRRPRTPADELPGDSLAELRSTGDAQPGEDPTSSRRVELPPGSVYLWPMEGGVCRSWGSSGGCVPLDTLRARGVTASTSLTRSPEDGTIEELHVSGIAADGVHDVRLIRRGGPSILVPVTENAFWVDLTGVGPPPESIQWEDDRGLHSQPLHLF